MSVLLGFSNNVFGQEPSIRVLILSGIEKMEMRVDQDYSVLDQNHSLVMPLPAGTECSINRLKETDADYELRRGENTGTPLEFPVIVVSKDPNAELTLHSVQVDGETQWEDEKARSYRGQFEMFLKSDGTIEVVLQLLMEDYLCGVVPSEIDASAAPEALKAQAVAARSEAYLSLVNRRYAGEHYDVCSDVMCQVFSGTTREDPRTNQAVQESRGVVMLSKNGNPLGAFYSAVCGGHTEHSGYAWPERGFAPYWRGHYDSMQPFELDLTQERDFRKWLSMNPNVYCNPENPGIPERIKKRFRWEKTVSNEELQTLVANLKDIGRIKSLKALSRGVSGRILALEIVGEKGTARVERELAIRGIFDPRLYSSAFIVETLGAREFPETFVLQGAGSGHGVGMCQVGAIGMGAQGISYEDILTHYYPGAAIERLY